MSTSLIDYGIVDFKKCDLLDHRLLLGIDCGSSLTKVIFLHKINKCQLMNNEIDFITFNHALFKNEKFKDIIKWIKEEAYIPKDTLYTIHVTGKRSMLKKDSIESILEVKVEYIDETLTTIGGHKIALEKIGLKSLIRNSVEVESFGKIDSKFLEQFAEGMSSKLLKGSEIGFSNTSSPFPCLIYVYGSSSVFYYFDDDGRGEIFSSVMTGGSSFLGLAKCLLDTNNYDEIMQLASEGNRVNVDTQVKDVMLEDIDSPYGRMPPDIPIFPFGKGMDYNKGLEYFAKQDVAISLAAFFAFSMTMHSLQQGQIKRINKVYLTGNIFRSNIFQKEIKRGMMIFPIPFNLEFLDIGYFGALGAMFCDNVDRKKYCKK